MTSETEVKLFVSGGDRPVALSACAKLLPLLRCHDRGPALIDHPGQILLFAY